MKLNECAICKSKFPMKYTGRPRKYCSARCRDIAYERRSRAKWEEKKAEMLAKKRERG